MAQPQAQQQRPTDEQLAEHFRQAVMQEGGRLPTTDQLAKPKILSTYQL